VSEWIVVAIRGDISVSECAGACRKPRQSPPSPSAVLPKESPLSDQVSHVNDADFDAQVLQSSEPVLVDFWAEWCSPCKAIAPLLDEIASNYAGRLRVAKVNVDHNQKTSRNFGIRGLPTLLLFKDGKVEATHLGMVSKLQLTQLLDKNL
jgi:thioredoxin 1